MTGSTDHPIAGLSPAPVSRRRRRLRSWLGVALLAGLLLYGTGLVLGMQPSVPFDVAINLGSFPHEPELQAAPTNSPPVERLVVLQHGLWRSPWALWKLERALQAHGYAVCNPCYPSTRATIEQHAARLRDALELRCAEPVPPGGRELYFVGHSMGGLVIQEYLRRPDARQPAACVFVATPHRGAVLADLRKRWWLFQWFMGAQAAMQLSPGDALHQRPVPMPCPVGTIVGARGDGRDNPDIPGGDDGTVAEAEARLSGESDSVTLPLGHTRIATDHRTIGQVLHFLRHRRFRPQ